MNEFMERDSGNQTEKETGKCTREKRGNRFQKGVLTGAAVTLFLTVCAACVFYFAGRGFVSENGIDGKLDQIQAIVQDYYLYGDEIDEADLIDGIYSGYTQSLGDPYTVYYNEEETQALLESTSGEFSGIGATMTLSSDGSQVMIIDVYEDSPAEAAGLKDGDALYQVDDHPVEGESLETVVSWVKGKRGTDVVLHIIRDGERLELTATRDTIQAQTVEYRMLEDRIGYIAVSEFDTVTYDQFKEALESLEDKALEGLVIDLRNNPGGSIDTTADMLRLLLPEGTIVSIEDKNGNVEEITCDGEHEFTKPLAVLVNENSASASEIFSGAVQDYGIGKIVGTTTYGKGVVQQLIDLGDDTCLKITIAEYFTPSGTSINGVGVTPDVEVDYAFDSEDPGADNQLEKALETVKEEAK